MRAMVRPRRMSIEWTRAAATEWVEGAATEIGGGTERGMAVSKQGYALLAGCAHRMNKVCGGWVMFEDSLFSSRKRKLTGRMRWTAAISLVLQGLVAGGLVLIPLLRTELLPMVSAAPKAVMLAAKRSEVREVKPRMVRMAQGGAVSVPKLVESGGGGRIARLMSTRSVTGSEDEPLLAVGVGMGSPGSIAIGMGDPGKSMSVRVVPMSKVGPPVRISSGVSAGMLLGAIRPVYPRIAMGARIEGTVVMTATIDRMGRIVGIEVVSGPAMLREAALEALREARYKPYRLNGEAVEVVTTVSVIFRMNG